MAKTAIMVDGAFFLKRFNKLYANHKIIDIENPSHIVKELENICYKHLGEKDKKDDLYRIFFYDCPPLSHKVQYPISKKALDFSKTKDSKLRTEIHNLLKRKRKVALRFGRLQKISGWIIKNDIMTDIIKGNSNILNFSDLVDDHFMYDVKQKSVDMKIGIDISTLALKKQVEKIILIAGDSDFVPASKLARREGIDFVLDSMYRKISDDLFEHIDGLKSYAYKKE